MPAPKVVTVQMFGLVDSRPTQAAQRFFKERRAVVTFVDLRRKPIAAGELRRFVERLGAAALLDNEVMERLLADPALLKLPLVRFGNAFTAGPSDATWKGWLVGTAK